MTEEIAKKRLEIWLKCHNCPEDRQCYDKHLNILCEDYTFILKTPLEEAIKVAISALSENKGEWIPISSIDEIPKKGAYWVTFEYENGHRYTSSIGWDSDREYWCDSEGWSMDKDDQKLITAYMPYFEPEPYKAESEDTRGGKE